VISFFRHENSQGDTQLPWLAIIITAIPVFVYLVLGPAPEWLIFDRKAVLQGEVWRLVTGHWVHSDAEHALWDIAALGILSVILDKQSRVLLIISLTLGTFGVDIWIWYINESLDYYCGLSGILNTVFISVIFSLWEKTENSILWIIFTGAVAKVLLEIITSQAVFTQTAWPSVPEVHAVGLLIGIVTMLSYKKLIKD